MLVNEKQILFEDITITFVSHSFPRNLMNHLKNLHKYDVQLIENSIYYIDGNILPIHLIVTKDLTDEQNLWLHNLTNDIHDLDVINTLITEYDKHPKEKHYKSVMDILVPANKDAFKEVTVVCKALEDLYWEVHGERIQREQKEALDKAVANKDALLSKKDAYIKQLEAQLGITTA